MNAADIERAAGAVAAVEVVAETGSTNADLLARVPTFGRDARNLLLVALRQNAGRGRAGRSWLSSESGSLTFSLAWQLNMPLHALAGLPLAVGVALADTLSGLGVRVQLKWPNDVLKDGAKLAGVLIETQNGPDGALWVVIGVGINLALPDALEAQLARPAASAAWLASMPREALLGALLGQLAASLGEFERHGFAAFSARWNRLHAWQGHAVTIVDRDVVLHEGSAAGVDDSGALLLDTLAGRIAIVAGDVSLRERA